MPAHQHAHRQPQRARVSGCTGAVLAALALFAGVASAEPGAGAAASPSAAAADVAIYGIFDSGLRHLDHVSPKGGVTQFSSGLNTSRFGLRGSEDLGEGWKAVLRLESGFNSGTGIQSNTSLFDRAAYVGVKGPDLEVRAGRQEGFGYELAAAGITDPLAMALNLPEYASPAAAGSKAPVQGANPLQAVYSYTYGQLRYNNALRVTTGGNLWSAGGFYAAGGIAGSISSGSVRGGHLALQVPALRGDALVQQATDLQGHHSTLYVLTTSWTVADWRLQAGVHRLAIGAGFDSTTLGNGASSSGILGSSTIVAPVLATAREDFRFQVADLGATWQVRPQASITAAAYRTSTEGAGAGHGLDGVLLGKWFFSPRVTAYVEADHAVSSGTLARQPVAGRAWANAWMAGLNVRF